MKRYLILICVGLIAFSGASCGKKGADEEAGSASFSATAEQSEKSEEISAEPEEQEVLSEAEPEEIPEEEIAVDPTDTIEGEIGENAPTDELEYADVPQQSVEYADGQEIYLNSFWTYAENSAIHSGCAVLYQASSNRNGIVIGVNAGHGTSGGSGVKTLCHPDGSAKTTGGTTAAGSTTAVAVSGGMSFNDGTAESTVTLRMAQILRDKLLAAGYDVLMVRDGSDVQLDNVARTVICNNVADCHISLHWDGDGLDYDKGCFYCSVPDGIKNMEPTASVWQEDNALGEALINGLRNQGEKINGSGSMAIDLTQTSYSTIPSVDMELGNACSDHSDSTLSRQADGLVAGINSYFGQ